MSKPDKFDFSEALMALREGQCIRRARWWAHDYVLSLKDGLDFTIAEPLKPPTLKPPEDLSPEHRVTRCITLAPCLLLVKRGIAEPFTPSQQDMQAHDWTVAELASLQ